MTLTKYTEIFVEKMRAFASHFLQQKILVYLILTIEILTKC